jgi:hypothetical protein
MSVGSKRSSSAAGVSGDGKSSNKRAPACVYLVFHCKADQDSGSDHWASSRCKENFDEEVLGVFFSLTNANKCAREHVKEIRGDEDDEDDEDGDDDDDAEDDTVPFEWDDQEAEWNDESYYNKVWVERRSIEDASAKFHA